MKKYLLGICAIILAISFSSFRTVNLIYFTPADATATNIIDAASYTTSAISCFGVPVDPCQIDLDLITGNSPNVTTAAQLVSFLQTNFSTSAARINYVKSISPVKKA